MPCETSRPRRHDAPGCQSREPLERHPTLAAVVRAYVANHRAKAADELDGFRIEPSLPAAIERAGMAQRRDGKRYDHQRRLSREVLRTATAALHRASLADAKNFADLHRRVKEALGRVSGVGELMLYDTTLRIGAHLGLLPETVYLHGGTRQGARALGLDWRADHLEVADLPGEGLQALALHEIEDCLCIYKDRLKTSV